jgi:hypothetical protein
MMKDFVRKLAFRLGLFRLRLRLRRFFGIKSEPEQLGTYFSVWDIE